VKKTKNNIHASKKKNMFACIFCIIALFFSAITLTVAWFQNDIVRNGLNVKSAEIDLDFYGFKLNDTEAIEEFHYISGEEIDESNEADGLIDDVFNLNKDEPAEYYFLVKKNTGCINLDANISFEIYGLNTGVDATNDFLSGYHFYFETLGDSDSNPLFNETQLSSSENVKTRVEEIASLQGQNRGERTLLTNINNKVWFISDLQSKQYVMYRLTIEQDYDSPVYQGNSFGISAKLQVAQTGALEENGITLFVHNSEELVNVIASYIPGSSIYIVGDVGFTGDVIFNRPVNLYVRNSTLTVYGSIRFEYSNANDFTVNTQLGGRIICKSVGGSGGSFLVDTPLSTFNFVGTNNGALGSGDIYIQNEFTFDANSDGGVTFTKVMIYNYSGAVKLAESNTLKTITLKDNTMLTVSRSTHIGSIFNGTYSVYNTNILNFGTIDQINLSRMKAKSYSDGSAQITIDNYSTITRIQLPTWAAKFSVHDETTNKLNSTGDVVSKVPAYVHPKYFLDTTLEIEGTLYDSKGNRIPFKVNDEQVKDRDEDPIYTFKDAENAIIYYYSVNNDVCYLLRYDSYTDSYIKGKIDDNNIVLNFVQVSGTTYKTERYDELERDYYSTVDDAQGNDVTYEVCTTRRTNLVSTGMTDNEGNIVYTMYDPNNIENVIYNYCKVGDVYYLEEYTGDYYRISKDADNNPIVMSVENVIVNVTEGNTRIIHEFGSCNLKSDDDSIIFGSEDYVCHYIEGEDDVEYNALSEYVKITSREGNNIAIQVYYDERVDEFGQSIDTAVGGTTLQILIDEFLLNETDGLTVTNITSLSVKTYDAKCMTTADYAYVRTLTKLTKLDLSETHSTNYSLPNSPFSTLYYLTSLNLPNDTTLGTKIFQGTRVTEVHCPASVTSVTTTTFTNIYFLHMDGYSVVNNLQPSSMYIFVPNSDVLTLYRNTKAYNSSQDLLCKFFVEAEHYGNYFLRLNGNSADFVLYAYAGYVSSLDPASQATGTYAFDFKSIKVNGTTYTITKYDDYALYNKVTTSNTVNLNFTDDSVTLQIGRYAFRGCTGIANVSIAGNVTLGQYAFGSCTKLVNFDVGGYADVETYAFSSTISMDSFIAGGDVTFGKYSFGSSTVRTIVTNDMTVGELSLSSSQFLREVIVNGDFNSSIPVPATGTNTVYYGAFYNDYRLMTVNMTNPDANVVLCKNLFYQCYGLAYLTVEGNGRFEAGSLYYCNGLYEIWAPKIRTVVGQFIANGSRLTHVYMPSLTHYESKANMHGTSSMLLEVGVPILHQGQQFMTAGYNVVIIHTETTTLEEQAGATFPIYANSVANYQVIIDNNNPALIDALTTQKVTHIVNTGTTRANEYQFFTPSSESSLDKGYYNGTIGERISYKYPGNYLYMLDGTVDTEDGNIPNATLLCDIYYVTYGNPSVLTKRDFGGGYIYDENNEPIAKINTFASKSMYHECFNGNRNKLIYEIPETVTTICDYAFYYNKCIQKLDSDYITYVGTYAFGESSLAYVYAPYLDIVGGSAFRNANLIYAYSPRITSCGNEIYWDNTDRLALVEIGPVAGSNMFYDGNIGTHSIIHTEFYDGDLSTFTVSDDYGDGFKFVDDSLYAKLVAKNLAYPQVQSTGEYDATEILYARSSPTSKSLKLTYTDPFTNIERVFFDAEYICTWAKDNGGDIIGVHLLGNLVPSYTETEFSVPEELLIDGVYYPVVDLAAYAYRFTTFTNVKLTIPDTITTIGKYCFKAGSTISELTFEGDISLQNYAFYNISSLKKLLCKGDITIANQCFYTCYNFESIRFEKNVTISGQYNFYSNSKLKELYFGGDYYDGGSDTFAYCTQVLPDENGELCFHGDARIVTNSFRRLNPQIKTLRVKGDLTITGNMYSSGCPLEYIYIEGDAIIGTSAFSGAKSLKYVQIDGTGTLGQSSFSGDSKLEIVNAPNIYYLNYYVFQNCTSLKYANLSGVTDYNDNGTSPFSGCSSLETLDLGAPVTISSSYFLSGINRNKLRFVFLHTEQYIGKTYTVPTKSWNHPFNGTNVHIYIDSNNTALFNLYNGIGAKYVADTGLARANEYHGVIIDPTDTDSIIEYGYTDAHGVYHEMYKAQSIVAYDEDQSEYGTTGESKLLYYSGDISNNEFDDLTTIDLTIDGVLTTTHVTFIADRAFEDSTFTNADIDLGNINTIGDYCFYGKSGINTLSSSETVTIASYAFAGCSDLTSVDIYEANLGTYCFSTCFNLTSIRMENGLTTATYAFNECNNITTYDLSGTINIGQYTFNGNTNLTELNIYDPDSSVIIDRYAFNRCPLEKLVIQGDSQFLANAFASNTTLKYVECYGNVTVGTTAFNGMTALVYVYMPEVTYLPANAFANCTKLEAIYMPMLSQVGATPFTGDNALTMVDIGFITNGASTACIFGSAAVCYVAVHAEAVSPEQMGVSNINTAAFWASNGIRNLLVYDERLESYFNRIFVDGYFTRSCTGTAHSDNYRTGDSAYDTPYQGFTNFFGRNYLYTIDNFGNATLISPCHTKSIIMDTYNVPGSLDGNTVVALGPFAYYKIQFNVRTMNLPASIKLIGDTCIGGYYAASVIDTFNGYGVEIIDRYAFSYSSCKKMYFPKAQEVREAGLRQQSTLGIVIFGPDIRTFGTNVFQSCNNLKSIYIQTTDTTLESRISGSLGTGFPGSANIYISKAVKTALYNSGTIAGVAASRYISYDTVYQASPDDPIFYVNKILNSDSSIKGYELFAVEANGNTTLTIPDTLFIDSSDEGNIISIKNMMFGTIGDEVETIVFPSYIETIYIDKSLLNRNIQNFEIADPYNPYYQCLDGVLYSGDMKTLIAYPKNNPRTDYILPYGVENISAYAFENVKNLLTLELPMTTNYVGKDAFLNSSLENIIFGGAPKISSEAFASTSIKNVVFNYVDIYTYAEFIGLDIFTKASSDVNIYVHQSLLANYESTVYYEMTIIDHLITFDSIIYFVEWDGTAEIVYTN